MSFRQDVGELLSARVVMKDDLCNYSKLLKSITPGADLIPAHLFVLYFAVLADATPPVSVAAYVAASLAKAGPIQTGLNALKLAIAGFIVGFSYLFSSALTLDGTGLEITIEAWRLLMALTVASACLAGNFARPLGLFARLGFAVACLFLLFHPGIADTASALGLTVLVAALWFCGKLGSQGPHQSERRAGSGL